MSSQPPNLNRNLIYAAIVVPLLILFQNCSWVGSAVSNGNIAAFKTAVATARAGGGEGYDGMRTYINRVDFGSCADGSTIRSLMKVVGANQAALVRDNCVDLQTPVSRSFDSIGLFPYNASNAVKDGHVFDLLTSQTTPESAAALFTKFLCRGSYKNSDTNQLQVADVIIKYQANGDLAYSARVVMAVYDPAGPLVSSLDSGDLVLKNISTEVAGRVKYTTPVVGLYSITLWIDKIGTETRSGKLSFIDLPSLGLDLQPGYTYRDYERVIQNLTCYAQ